MRTIETKVYSFNELSDTAKENAIRNLSDINISFDWWDYIYDEAKNTGFKINSFSDRDGCDISLIWDIEDVMRKIMVDHGESCDTWLMAKEYQDDYNNLVAKYSRKDNEDIVDEDKIDEFDSELDELNEEFEGRLAIEYMALLSSEYEYQTSDEVVIESILVNDYEFTEDGVLA